jgi:predicted Fe-Mo cluster-binding NifX family protein
MEAAMKIAISAKGPDLDAAVDPHFGRAAYLLIIEPESLAVLAIDNSANVRAFKGAGIGAATMIHEKGAKALLTGFCGPNAFKTCQAAGIQVINDVSGTVRQAVEDFKNGAFVYAEAPNTEGHI